MCIWGKAREREGERENPQQVLCCQHRASRGARSHDPGIMTCTEIMSRTLSRLSHPRVPNVFHDLKSASYMFTTNPGIRKGRRGEGGSFQSEKGDLDAISNHPSRELLSGRGLGAALLGTGLEKIRSGRWGTRSVAIRGPPAPGNTGPVLRLADQVLGGHSRG